MSSVFGLLSMVQPCVLSILSKYQGETGPKKPIFSELSTAVESHPQGGETEMLNEEPRTMSKHSYIALNLSSLTTLPGQILRWQRILHHTPTPLTKLR